MCIGERAVLRGGQNGEVQEELWGAACPGSLLHHRK